MATALGSAAVFVLRLHGGAGPQQQRDHLDAALPCRQVQWRPASGRRRTRVVGKLARCASCTSLKSDKRTPGEKQGEERAFARKDCIPVSSDTVFEVVADAGCPEIPEPITARM